VNLPDGTGVTVLSPGPFRTIGLPDDEWPTDPKGIARLVARMDCVKPFDMTPAEEAEAQAWRQKVKEYTLAYQHKAVTKPPR
jgi:hypothetical protein